MRNEKTGKLEYITKKEREENPDWFNKVCAYYSARYMEGFTETKSLNKLEKLVQIQDPGYARLNYVSAAYIFYNKMNVLSKIKHPTLYENVQHFIKNRFDGDEWDVYRKVQVVIERRSKAKEIDSEQKRELKDYINDYLESTNQPLISLTSRADCDYSSLHKFLSGDLNQVSLRKLDDVMKLIMEGDNEKRANTKNRKSK